MPHGEVRIVYYPSAVIGNLRRMYMYFPPGYEQGKTRYPVAYLIHGGGDEDWAWITLGRINFILDNLIAEGKARPMIVVMPNMWAIGPPLDDAGRAKNVSLIQKSLVQEIIPFVEQHYSVRPGRDNRAFGGLGIMRTMLPNLLWPLLDQFNYIGFASGGTDPDQFEALQKQYPGVLDDPTNAKRVKFFLGDGANDSSINSSIGFAAELKKRGYSVTTFESTGTHGWPAFRRSMIEWLQSTFR